MISCNGTSTFVLTNDHQARNNKMKNIVEVKYIAFKRITGRNTNGTALNFYFKIAIITQSLCTMVVRNPTRSHSM